jgi:hypothetical protein
MGSSLTSCLFGQIASKDFVIDSSKPWVYLRFDHVSPGKPGTPDEAGGLFIRIVNNSRIPIVIRASGGLDGERAVSV